jgi:hypothetical protein
MTAVGVVEVAACAVLAIRARRSGREDRRRYLQGMYGFLAWTGLCFARVLLLRGGG